MTGWRVVLAKELRETLRDRRTLLVMVVVPVLLYPVLLIVMEQLLLFGMRNLEAEAAPVALVGSAPVELIQRVENDDRFRLVLIGDDPARAIREDSVTAVALFGPPVDPEGTRVVTLLFDAASDRSNRGHDELARVVGEWRDSLLVRRLDQRGLSRTFATPVQVADSSVARPEEVGGYMLGRILPLLLVIITLLGTFYPAIDLAAGEKERGTLETLMTAPVSPEAIVVGKFATVALIGIVAAGLNLASMLLTFQSGILQFTAAIGLEVSIPVASVLVIFLTLIPLAVLFGALFLGIAVGSSSFKEAQNALTPISMLVLIPVMLPVFPGIGFGPLMAITPVAGVSFFFRDLMGGDADVGLGALVLLSTTVYAALALVFAARAFGSERVLFGGDEGGSATRDGTVLARWRSEYSSAGVPTLPAAGLFVAVVAVLFFWGAVPLQIRFGEGGLLAAEWLLLFVPTLGFVGLFRLDATRSLSLRRPTLAQLGGGVVLIAGSLPLVWLLGWLQSFILPMPQELLQGLEELVTAETAPRFLWLLLVLAVTPAVCEEVVFRGVLLGAARTMAPWRMILLNGVVFGAFHLSFETVIRFLPAATLGIVIAWAVWRTGSLFVGVAMHFVNNAVIVGLASTPALREAFSDPEAPPPLWLVPLGALACTIGIQILRTSVPEPSGPTTHRIEEP